jgi:hypothetical protein
LDVTPMPSFPSTSPQVSAEARAAALSSGRYDLLVDHYLYPLTVYIKDMPRVFAQARDLWAFFQSVHASLRAEGFDRLAARVTAEDMPRGGRFRVWADWIAQGPGHKSKTVATTVCYCTVVSGGSATEMLEFTRLDLPLAAAA